MGEFQKQMRQAPTISAQTAAAMDRLFNRLMTVRFHTFRFVHKMFTKYRSKTCSGPSHRQS
jgi:hypothetical protein